MAVKTCTKCGRELDLSMFNRNCKSKDGLCSSCKDCQKLWREQNKDKIREYNQSKKDYYKQYDENRKNNPDRIASKKQYSKKRYRGNKDAEQMRMREYASRPEVKEHRRQYYKKCKMLGLTKKSYTEEEKRKQREYNKKYREENAEKLKEYDKQRRANPAKRLNCAVSSNISSMLKGNKNNRHWEDLLPYNSEQLMVHLEKQFTSEMNWDNYGSYWELDHIIPKNLFDFNTNEDKEFQICWSLMNLRPLEKIANRSRPKDGSDISEQIKQQILNQEV